MVGQPYRILNSDGILHNVHSLPKVNTAFNRPMPATLKEATTTFDKPEAIFQIKCDVHPWMSAYIGVFTHPFFSATGTDGKFTISGLDPGTYEITAWHERLGTQTASVTVGASDTKTQNFKFAMPARSSDPENSRMSQPGAVAAPDAARRARSPSRGARLLAQVRLLHRPQGHRHPVRHHRPPVPALRLFADDAHALAARLPGRRAAADRRPLRRGAHAGRGDAP